MNFIKTISVLGIFVLLYTSCSKDEQYQESQVLDVETKNFTKAPAPKINVCHFAKSDQSWEFLEINENSLESHLKHGDAVDMDGDGYFNKNNGCTETDCDDTNAAVNPGAEEICENEIDDDCDGAVDELDSDCEVALSFPESWVGTRWNIVEPTRNFLQGTYLEFISSTVMKFSNSAVTCQNTMVLEDIQDGVYKLRFLQDCTSGAVNWYIFPLENGDFKFGSQFDINNYFNDIFTQE